MDGIISFFSGLEWSALLGAGSAVVAIISAIFSWRTMRKQERRQTMTLKLAHDNDIIRWSDGAIVTLAQAHEMLCEKGVAFADADFRMRRSELRAQLSAVIDRGRLFFPNRSDGEYGADKEAAFRGRRHPALDRLVEAYELLGRSGDQMGPDRASAEELTKIRRLFVTEVFNVIDPVRRGLDLKEAVTG